MTLAVASGKGGTGKTTVSTNLAETAAARGLDVQLLDADVEEPNCHIFVSPQFETSTPVTVQVPSVDESKCIGCGACADICQFSAIAMAGEVPITFPDLCHSCTGCWRVCPTGAITPQERAVGMLGRGRGGGVNPGAGVTPGAAPGTAGTTSNPGAPSGSAAGAFEFVQGSLNVGESVSSPVIHAVLGGRRQAELTVIDAPPGTACPVVEATHEADYLILVTEPTPFGLNDLELAVEMVRKLGVPFGVVINRADVGDAGVREYCRREGIEVLLEFPDDRRVAEAYSRGELATRAVPELRARYGELITTVLDRARGHSHSGEAQL